MFTGIVEARGQVTELAPAPGGGARLRVTAPWPAASLQVGESVAVNGCCLTVTAAAPSSPDGCQLTFDLMAETLRRTALGGLAPGDAVNLERALAAGGRLGGHLVQGHVDGVGRVAARRGAGPGGAAGAELRVTIGRELARYVVEKGSIAVDGVSLTVTEVGVDWFEVALVPHTLAVTTLGERRPGDPVHIEVDVLAKYVERLLGPYRDGAWEGQRA